MKSYRLLDVAAKNANTDVTTLSEFGRAGWIEVVSKQGCCYVSAQDEYRCRFILHLKQRLRLTDEQIGIVLANAQAPYAVEQVREILARYDQS